MDTEDSSRKSKKNSSEAKTDSLKPKSVERKENPEDQKQKNSWEPKPNDVKPKSLTLTKDTKVEKRKKFIKAENQKSKSRIKNIHQSLNPTALHQSP